MAKSNSNTTVHSKKKKGSHISEEEQRKLSAKEWLPIKDIIRGIIVLKNGTYVKIVEVVPVNFKLKSKQDKRFLIINYRAFLKACRFPMQISVQCKRADVDPHINRVRGFLKVEKNDNVKNMLHGYISLINSLSIGSKAAVSRRFFLIIPYVHPTGVKESSFEIVEKQLLEKHALVREFLSKCGNEVLDNSGNEYTANILYTYLNKGTCEIQRFGGKLLNLTGVFVKSREEEEDDEE